MFRVCEINKSGPWSPCVPGNYCFLRGVVEGKGKMMETELSGLVEDNLCSKAEETKGDGSKQLLFYLLILLLC